MSAFDLDGGDDARTGSGPVDGEVRDLGAATWTEFDRPDDAPVPGDFVGDKAVYALDGAATYQVKEGIGPDGRLTAWISDGDGKTWKSMPSEPSGAFRAADGKLLSVVADDGAAAFALTGGTRPVRRLRR